MNVLLLLVLTVLLGITAAEDAKLLEDGVTITKQFADPEYWNFYYVDITSSNDHVLVQVECKSGLYYLAHNFESQPSAESPVTDWDHFTVISCLQPSIYPATSSHNAGRLYIGVASLPSPVKLEYQITGQQPQRFSKVDSDNHLSIDVEQDISDTWHMGDKAQVHIYSKELASNEYVVISLEVPNIEFRYSVLLSWNYFLIPNRFMDIYRNFEISRADTGGFALFPHSGFQKSSFGAFVEPKWTAIHPAFLKVKAEKKKFPETVKIDGSSVDNFEFDSNHKFHSVFNPH
ncbi:hypothetical protein GEMRC1_000668 [Eukaryota sp. GEM-RC1]